MLVPIRTGRTGNYLLVLSLRENEDRLSCTDRTCDTGVLAMGWGSG